MLGKDLGREDARDLVRPRSRAPLELAVTTLLGPVDFETLEYSDHSEYRYPETHCLHGA